MNTLSLSFKETYNCIKKAFNRFLARTNTRRPVYILTKATDKDFSLPPSSSTLYIPVTAHAHFGASWKHIKAIQDSLFLSSQFLVVLLYHNSVIV